MKQQGFILLEALLASTIFGMVVGAFVGAYLDGLESSLFAGNLARATLIAEEGLEAVRNIRDDDVDDLTNGTHGLATQGNKWVLSGSNDTTENFTREIIISTPTSTRKDVTVNVTWQQNPRRTGSVSLSTRLSNWFDVGGGGAHTNCAQFCQDLNYTTGVCREDAPICIAEGGFYEPEGGATCQAWPSVNTCCCLFPQG